MGFGFLHEKSSHASLRSTTGCSWTVPPPFSMTASKLSKGASDRLLNLLYASSSVEIANKTPLVAKFIHDLPSASAVDQPQPPRSILEDLTSNNWNRKPWSSVASDLPETSATQIRSNILKFKCKNNFISNDTFHNLYPIERERKYQLPTSLVKNGPPFFAIKGRNSLDLQPVGVYYLVFQSFSSAAAYWLETAGKVINGFDFKLEFMELTSKDLNQMSSPHISSSYGEQVRAPLIDHPHSVKSPKSQSLAKKEDLTYPYSLMLDYSMFEARQSMVLVKNLPFGLSKHALPKILWDYDLATSHDTGTHEDCITSVISDPVNQVSLTLIRFADRTNAVRFIRNFHGRKWESIQTKKEKKLYEPILCEILD
ncbi:hypothetical protein CLIB1423_10S01948 [[Candida] railenensis]|uniref:Uncharacterized protein n=1 Tax=[Candida] railenensis TaxID=45579 RepID=A0A9P0VY50_9ASCO|nr:hypothetical protein CLIB1423_10S01948 [[Candida] railenensis]